MTSDFSVSNLHGSICILTPLSDAASEWLDENLDPDHQTWGRGVVVEPRYLEDLVAGIAGDGLTI